MAESMSGNTQNRQHETPMNDNSSSNSVQARLLAEQLSTLTGRPFDACWREIRASRPDLLPLDNRQAKATAAVAPAFYHSHPQPGIGPHSTITECVFGGRYEGLANRMAASRPQTPPRDETPLSSGKLASKIDEFRATRPDLSYVAARDALRARHPGWFGV